MAQQEAFILPSMRLLASTRLLPSQNRMLLPNQGLCPVEHFCPTRGSGQKRDLCPTRGFDQLTSTNIGVCLSRGFVQYVVLPRRRLLSIQGLCSATQLTSTQHGALPGMQLYTAGGFFPSRGFAQPDIFVQYSALLNMGLLPYHWKKRSSQPGSLHKHSPCPAVGFCH